MKQLTFEFGTRSFGLLAAASMALMVSCSKDSDYDGLTESDGIDLSFNIAPGGLTLPFGSYEKIYLTELLDTADVDVLERYENGLYYIAKDGEISETTFNVDEVKVDIAPDINPLTVDFAAAPPANIQEFLTEHKQFLSGLFGDKFNLSILADPQVQALASLPTEFPVELFSQDIAFEGADFNIDAANVDGLIQIDEVTPEGDIKIRLSIEVALPSSTQSYRIVMNNLDIELPDFIVLDNGTSHYTSSGKTIVVNANETKAVWKDEITISRLDFAHSAQGALLPTGDRLLRSGNINISTEVRVEDYTIGAENIVYDLNAGTFTFAMPLSVDPAAEVNTIVLKEVTGRFSPAIDPVTAEVNIDLGDDMDFLTGNETTLDFVNPQIHLNITNTSPVKILADITLTADNGSTVTYMDVNLTPDHGDTKSITLQSQPSAQDDVYANPLLSTFLSPIPENVTVTVQPRTDSEGQYTMTLAKDINVSGNYDLTVPLQYNNVNIRYDEVIENLFGEGDDAKDVTDRLPAIDDDSEVTLSFTITNAIPLGLTLRISAYGYDGVEDAALAYIANTDKSFKVGAGSIANPNVQPVEFRLAIPRTADVRDLILRVEAAGTDGELNSNQYIKLDDIKLLLKNLKVDLNDKD